MNRLVVNADDFGLSREINKGIVTGLEQGVISDTSLLVDAPFSSEALRLLEEAGISAVGIHVNLDLEFGWDLPATERFPREELMAMLADPSFLARCKARARSQIEKLLSSGLTPTHLDTHHHVHGFFPVFSLLAGLAREYGIPAMRFSPTGYRLTSRKPIPFDGPAFLGMRDLLRESGIYFCPEMVEGVDRLSDIGSYPAELVAHPSLGGDEWRVRELETLLSDEFRGMLEEKGIRLVSFVECAAPAQGA